MNKGRITENLGILGGILTIIGLGGLGEAATGQGSFMVATIVFSIGFGLALMGWSRT